MFLDTITNWKKKIGALVSVLFYVRNHICFMATRFQARYLNFGLLAD